MFAREQVLQDRYRLDDVLGGGGQATVYRGFDTKFEINVAIKVLAPRFLAGQSPGRFAARFKREAQLIAAMDHDNIVKIFDYHLDESLSLAYLVMPLLERGTLRQQLREGKIIDLTQVRAILIQVAQGLDYAYAQKQVVHLDIKPDNILLHNTYPRYLVADFGLAKILVEDPDARHSTPGGTPHYMAPEQWRKRVNRACDVYSLGCMLFELLTGTLPYSILPSNISTVEEAHARASIPDVAARSHGLIPPVFQPVIDRALAKRPEDRFPTAMALADAFAEAMQACPPFVFSWHPSFEATISGISVAPVRALISPRKASGYSQAFEQGALYWSETYGRQALPPAVSDYHHTRGGAKGWLGFPASPNLEAMASRRGTTGRFQRFEGPSEYPVDVAERLETAHCGATIYSSAAYGTHATAGGIGVYYEKHDGTGGSLGFPASDEADAAPSPRKTTGRFQRFEGPVDYPAAVIALLETSRCGATLYWLAGHHIVCATMDAIGICYELMRGTSGPLGFPLTDTADAVPSPRNTQGRFQRFEDGAIYESAIYGTHPVRHGINFYYDALGGSGSPLGFPSAPEVAAEPSPFGTTGACQRFEGPADYTDSTVQLLGHVRCGAVVYWSEEYQTHATFGPIGERYERAGGSGGFLGFPIADEHAITFSPYGTAGVAQDFEGGMIVHAPTTGSWLVVGDFADAYRQIGGPGSLLGLPLGEIGLPSAEFARAYPATQAAMTVIQEFEGGWLARSGTQEQPVAILRRDIARYPGGADLAGPSRSGQQARTIDVRSTMANPHYYHDLALLDGNWDLSNVAGPETIFIVTGTFYAAELLDRPVAELLRDEIVRRGYPAPWRRAIVVSDTMWNSGTAHQNHPVIAVGGPAINTVTESIRKKGTSWNHDGLLGSYHYEPAPQLALWADTSAQTRDSVLNYIGNPDKGLDHFLSQCWPGYRKLTSSIAIAPANGLKVSADGGSASTLAEAIAAAEPGATILLGTGIYALGQGLALTKPLELCGEGMGRTIITAENGDAVLSYDAPGELILRDLALRWSGREDAHAEVVRIASGRVRIEHCGFSDAPASTGWEGSGLHFRGEATGTVVGCLMERNGYGIQITENATPLLLANTCRINRFSGIAYFKAAGGTARQNRSLENGRRGILVSGQASPMIDGNVCDKNKEAGIALHRGATAQLQNNRCRENGRYGIDIPEGAGPLVTEDNVCSNNGRSDFHDRRVPVRL